MEQVDGVLRRERVCDVPQAPEPVFWQAGRCFNRKRFDDARNVNIMWSHL